MTSVGKTTDIPGQKLLIVMQDVQFLSMGAEILPRFIGTHGGRYWVNTTGTWGHMDEGVLLGQFGQICHLSLWHLILNHKPNKVPSWLGMATRRVRLGALILVGLAWLG